MRLWTLHPSYLDTKALVAAWREGLLAQKVLHGRTRGYLHHPQLLRFRACVDPCASIAAYLEGLHIEAVARGFSFDASKIERHRAVPAIEETSGQLRYELSHLEAKVRARSPKELARLPKTRPAAHPLFRIVRGAVRDWERIARG
jgi:hypothetical protein